MTTVVDAENEAIRVSLEYQEKIKAIQEKLKGKPAELIKNKMSKILSHLSPDNLEKMLGDIDKFGLTNEDLKDYSKRLNKDWDKKTDANQKLERLYKIQMIGEYLNYQNKFCPGGFNTEGEIGENLLEHNKGLTAAIKELIKNTKVLVISNEALDMVDKRKIDNTKMIQHAKKEYFSFSSKDGLETEPKKHGDNTSKITIGRKAYYSQHLPSLKYEEREEASAKYFEEGGAFDTFLDSVKKNFGGFAGDINLYPATVSDNSWKLRGSVLNILKKYNLVLFTAKHKINKNARARFQDQWHKVKEGGNTEPDFRSDSLIVVEPFDEKKDYNVFASENPNICVFLPSGEHKNVSGEIKKYQPFTFKDGDKLLMITDHFVVKGTDISIFSGADGDGKGLKPKKFIGLDPQPYVGDDHDQKKMDTLNKMVKIITKINEFLTNFNNENLADISAGSVGGRRRKSKRRKSKRRKSKRRKSKRRKSKRRKSKRRKSKRRKSKR